MDGTILHKPWSVSNFVESAVYFYECMQKINIYYAWPKEKWTNDSIGECVGRYRKFFFFQMHWWLHRNRGNSVLEIRKFCIFPKLFMEAFASSLNKIDHTSISLASIFEASRFKSLSSISGMNTETSVFWMDIIVWI